MPSIVVPCLRYRDARAAGATILEEPADTEFGTRGFLCRDPEGHVWKVGTYRPRETEALFS